MPAPKKGFVYFCIWSAVFVGCLGRSALSVPADAKSEWKLSEAPIDPQVKARILASIVGLHLDGSVMGLPASDSPGDEKEQARAIALQSVVKLARLDKQGRIGIEVNSVASWCGATGNCDVYLFDAMTGKLLLQSEGWEYWFGRTTHHGFFDFYVRDNLSAGTGTLSEYQFDGNKYQETDRKSEPPFTSHSPL